MRTPRWTDEQRGKPSCKILKYQEKVKGGAVVGVTEVGERDAEGLVGSWSKVSIVERAVAG